MPSTSVIVAPEPPAPKRWKVVAFAANVRSSPGVMPGNIVGSLKQGDVITIESRRGLISLLARADAALYKAKAAGRNCVVVTD